MEKAVEKNEKLKSFRLESFCLSWKEPSEIRKNRAKLERTERSWRVSSEVGKFRFNYSTSIDLSKFNSSFPTSLILFNFNLNFPNLFLLNNFKVK